jgi:hypothetical protein
MATMLQGYFTHAEAKAAGPHGVGLLQRRQVGVKQVVVLGKESNRLALIAAEDTFGTVGGQQMGGSVVYGATGEREALALLFVEDIADLMAATCLPRSTLYAVRHGSTSPAFQTLTALRAGMRLSDPDNPQSIVGWREALPTPEAVAEALGCALERARALRSGKERWTPGERANLVAFIAAQCT